jgi:hypothetical protein
MLAQEIAPVVAAELTALIRMNRYRTLRLPSPDCHQERGHCQFAIDALIHRPTDYLAREQIQDDGEIKPSLIGTDVRDVRHPDAIKFLHVELALQMIGRHSEGAPPRLYLRLA